MASRPLAPRPSLSVAAGADQELQENGSQLAHFERHGQKHAVFCSGGSPRQILMVLRNKKDGGNRLGVFRRISDGKTPESTFRIQRNQLSLSSPLKRRTRWLGRRIC